MAVMYYIFILTFTKIKISNLNDLLWKQIKITNLLATIILHLFDYIKYSTLDRGYYKIIYSEVSWRLFLFFFFCTKAKINYFLRYDMRLSRAEIVTAHPTVNGNYLWVDPQRSHAIIACVFRNCRKKHNPCQPNGFVFN